MLIILLIIHCVWFAVRYLFGHKSMKAPPSEKPPPVPPINDAVSSNIDEEIDKQEQAIIASLEMEEREHKRYMETQEKMRSMFNIHDKLRLKDKIRLYP